MSLALRTSNIKAYQINSATLPYDDYLELFPPRKTLNNVSTFSLQMTLQRHHPVR